MKKQVKYVFITGGVVSSLGKGVTSASLALLLKSRGYRVFMQKLDPYLNVDPGTMSPYQHGEVFVTDDGAETDLDLGHYERFAGVTCSKASNYTSGRIYSAVLARERAGGYLGGTVQVVPHITDEIKAAIRSAGEAHGDEPAPDIVLCEIGGVSGDIESLPFLEAARQFRFEEGNENTCFVHLTLVPYLKAAGELKTKPSQHSVGMLRNIGIIPDILVCRTEMTIPEEHLKKLAMFCNVKRECVIEEKDVADSVYAVPRELREQGLDEQVLRQVRLDLWPIKHTVWDTLVRKATQPKKRCRIALVGKYISIRDAYKSVHEALQHAGMANDCKVEVVPIEAEELTDNEPHTEAQRHRANNLRGSPLLGHPLRGQPAAGGYVALCDLKNVDGILVPGGFGSRGVEGKIAAIKYAREKKIPFLGICLGMQCTVIEYARDVLGWKDANSTEFDESTTHPVIDLMEEQRGVTQKGGTMRLGAYPCVLKKDSLADKLYGTTKHTKYTKEGSAISCDSCISWLKGAPVISERHRHRYEFANDTKPQKAIEAAGLVASGLSPDGKLVEIVELPGHPYFIASQFHPEFKSRPTIPHPLFNGLVKAALKNGKREEGKGKRE
ncbi:MAG: CTP synthase [Kiritimatiellae bacterium]|nr:CTP synthase [Kiritimatiellia bacterium]